MNKKILAGILLTYGLNVYATDFCKKDFMMNLEYSSKKINLKDKHIIKSYKLFSGKKHINIQIAKTTYNYLSFNFMNEEVANRWIDLIQTYLENEREHFGIDKDISQNDLFFSTLKEVGLFIRYDKQATKDFYLKLFKKYDFFSEDFQRSNIYKYMIMKNLDVASKKDLDLYLKQIKSRGEIYNQTNEEKYSFANKYYYAFFTNVDIALMNDKLNIGNKQSTLQQISTVCSRKDRILNERMKPISIDFTLDLFYQSIIYPEMRPVIERYFIATGLLNVWSFWNYEYYKKREDYFLASHYFQLYYSKATKKLKKIIYFDLIDIRTKELEWLIKHDKNYEAYENAIGLIVELSSIKEGIEDKYFPLVNIQKKIINDSSSVILEEIAKSGDYKTYDKIVNERDTTVLHILKRKY